MQSDELSGLTYQFTRFRNNTNAATCEYLRPVTMRVHKRPASDRKRRQCTVRFFRIYFIAKIKTKLVSHHRRVFVAASTARELYKVLWVDGLKGTSAADVFVTQ